MVVGSAESTTYGYAKDGNPILTKNPKLLLNDNTLQEGRWNRIFAFEAASRVLQ